jgi:hypothetical protein
MVEPGETFLVQGTPPNLHLLHLPVDSVEVLPRHRGCV